MAIIRDNIFVSAGTITNSINCVNCIRGVLDGNEEFGVVTNYFNNGALSQNMTFGTNVALAATNQRTGSGSYLFIFDNGSGAFTALGSIASSSGGNIIGGNYLSAADNFQGLFFNGATDIDVRGPTGGIVRLQDESGMQFANFNATASNLLSPLKVGASGSSISDSRELLQSVHSCGTTTTCANTANGTNREVFGSLTLSAGAATLSSISPAFTSITSFSCVCSDQTSAAACKAVVASTSSVTFAGTGTDVLSYSCKGN